MKNKLPQFDEFIKALMDGVNRGGHPEILYYSKSNRYIVWKINGHTRWAAVGQTCYEKSEYTLSDLKGWEKKVTTWGGSSLDGDTLIHQIRGRINKQIIKDWEKEIGEKLIKVEVVRVRKLKVNNAIVALEAATNATVLKESEDPRTSYLRMGNEEFVKWLKVQCEEGSAMYSAAERIEDLEQLLEDRTP